MRLELVKHEIRKMINRYSVIGVTAVLLLIGIFIYAQYSYGVTIGIMDSSHHFEGAEYINRNREISDMFAGRVLDDEFFLEFDTAVLESIQSDENGLFNPKNSLQMSTLHEFYNIMRTGDNYAYGVKSTDMDSVLSGDKPIYRYTDNWDIMRSVLSSAELVVIIFAVILASLTFSKEYAAGMTQIIYPTKFGCRNFARAKLLALYIFITAVFLSAVIISVCAVGGIWGFYNADADIRVMTGAEYITMREPISCFSLIFMQILIGYGAMLVMTSFAVVISSLVKSPVAALIIGTAAFFIPKLIPTDRVLPKIAMQTVALMPLNQLNLLTSSWSLFGYDISILAAVMAAAVILSLISAAVSTKIYSLHKIA